MSISGQGSLGKMRWLLDAAGAEVPITGTSAYASTDGKGSNLGDFRVVGSVQDADAGIVGVSKANGFLRFIASATTDADSIGIATEVCLSPILNGPLVLEARLEMQALTARNVWIGFSSTIEDEINEPITATGTAITKVVHCLGFYLSSDLTAGTYWHMPYLLAGDTTQTSTDVVSTQVAVAGECDVLKLEVYPNGGARWFINGKLEQTVAAALAATPATLLGADLSVYAQGSAVADFDLDYALVEANRDWTR